MAISFNCTGLRDSKEQLERTLEAVEDSLDNLDSRLLSEEDADETETNDINKKTNKETKSKSKIKAIMLQECFKSKAEMLAGSILNGYVDFLRASWSRIRMLTAPNIT